MAKGYADFLQAINDPKHHGHENMRHGNGPLRIS